MPTVDERLEKIEGLLYRDLRDQWEVINCLIEECQDIKKLIIEMRDGPEKENQWL